MARETPMQLSPWNRRVRGVFVRRPPLEDAMFAGRSWESWIADYSRSHQNPVNRVCHSFGIPMIVVAIIVGVFALFVPHLWPIALILFVLGWVLQFVGHAIEGKPPEFFKDWRFLFVGLRWWVAKMQGKA